METTHNDQAEKRRTRIAPTPSGYLHLGNIYSFAVTAAFAHVTGADTLLRIDDLDALRAKPVYINDIFETLSFLEIPWSSGPRGPEEFEKNFSQLNRRSVYDEMLQRLSRSGLVYACTCSRSELALNKGPGYPGTCRNKEIPLHAADVCWRLVTRHDVELKVQTPGGIEKMLLPREMRDFVVRKKDGSAAYQLSSVADDRYFGISLVVRGKDLLSSTLAQLYLAHSLDMTEFADTLFYHHRLLFTGTGEKLSKSAGDTSVNFLRREGATPRQIYEMAGKLAGIERLTHWPDLCGAVSQLFDKGNHVTRPL